MLTAKIMSGIGKPRMPLKDWEIIEELLLEERNKKSIEKPIKDVRQRVVEVSSNSDSIIVDEEALLEMAS